MATGINNFVGVGRLAADPEIKNTPNSVVAKFALALERYAGKGRENKTDFLECQAWGNSARFLEKYAKKGALLSVEGSVETSTYPDSLGRKRKYVYVNAHYVKIFEFRGLNIPPGEISAMNADTLNPEDLPF